MAFTANTIAESAGTGKRFGRAHCIRSIFMRGGAQIYSREFTSRAGLPTSSIRRIVGWSSPAAFHYGFNAAMGMTRTPSLR